MKVDRIFSDRRIEGLMKSIRVASFALMLLTTVAPLFAQRPVSHRLIAQDKGHVAIVNEKGDVEWVIANEFVSHDIGVLPNGNLLLHTGPATITEVTPEKQIVWHY